MKLSFFFADAFKLLAAQPKLFFPKLVVSGLFGVGMLLTAQIASYALDTANVSPESLFSLFSFSLFLLFFTFCVSVFDTIVNAMYPLMVKNHREGKKVSLTEAAWFALGKAKIVVPADIGVLLLFSVIALPIEYFLVFSLNAGNNIAFFASALLLAFFVFFMAVSFYWLYPVATMEKVGVVGALKRAFFLSRKNSARVSIASVVPFCVSLANIGLAFLSGNAGFFFLFILMRFVTAVVYTYHLVLNPALYYALAKGGN